LFLSPVSHPDTGSFSFVRPMLAPEQNKTERISLSPWGKIEIQGIQG
jgi:hypothetical protein